MFVNKTDFLKLFEKNHDYNKFIINAKVKTHKNIIPLKEYMQKNDIDEKNIKLLYSHIQNKDKYLSSFYDTSLKLPQPDLHITESPMTNIISNNEKIKYKNVIRNLHYLHILKYTESGLNNTRTYLQVLEDLYKKEIIDYKLLTPSALHYLQINRFGGVFSSFYFRASILNPYLIYSLNETYLKGTKIFTPTLGWSSYLYGFFECSHVKEYVGTDVINDVCKKTKEFAKTYNKKCTIYCKPSEKLLDSESFSKKYKNYFDVVFFSPPYYELELYDSKNQSTNSYKSYEEWLEKYWEKTIQLCYYVLQKHGKLCYILSGYGKNLQYDLVKDMNEISSKYFKQSQIKDMHNKNANMTKHRNCGEKIMFYIKS